MIFNFLFLFSLFYIYTSMEKEEKDIQGKALLDYFLGKKQLSLLLHTSYGPVEKMPVEVFFRDKSDFSRLECFALQFCRGTVLDIGAGAGSFALELQHRGLSVKALELSPLSCRIMRQRGVQQVQEGNIWDFKDEKFDTLLLMMNGIGLAGEEARLQSFLEKLKTLLLPGGQILFDSSDIGYMYAPGEKPTDHYFGEIRYCYEYEGEKGDWFGWLYADVALLEKICKSLDMRLKVLFQNQRAQFLARISFH